MGGTDCGFAQSPFAQRVHPSIMWAKLRSLSEGARIADRRIVGQAQRRLKETIMTLFGQAIAPAVCRRIDRRRSCRRHRRGDPDAIERAMDEYAIVGAAWPAPRRR